MLFKLFGFLNCRPAVLFFLGTLQYFFSSDRVTFYFSTINKMRVGLLLSFIEFFIAMF